MIETINWFAKILHVSFLLYFKQDSTYNTIRSIPMPEMNWIDSILQCRQEITFEERIVLLLALMPHISPQILDMFFIKNKDLDRNYTEFGGYSGKSHIGFLPTGETAVFILSVASPEGRKEALTILGKTHWFYRDNFLRCEGQEEGEPFLSGHLTVSDELLANLYNIKYEPEYNAGFPAKRIITPLDWEDLVLPYNLREELDDIVCWIRNQDEIRQDKKLNRIIKQGYRCLFYGPPGTGKTLTATLLGKQNNLDVYRVDLSMIVSKYIGETEKNLAKVFDKAEHQNWILFFDEADALFGQRSETQSSNDRHANQEVAYLLQRIEDFPGIVILATNLKENIDEAFFRRFQSSLYFPMPDQRLRYQLWKNMLPDDWLNSDREMLLREASLFDLSGGSMVNVIQSCAIKLYNKSDHLLTIEVLKTAIRRELFKEGKRIG